MYRMPLLGIVSIALYQIRIVGADGSSWSVEQV